MKFLSDILAKAGLTVDGVVTLNNTATGQTPDANDNSTKLATTAWVRTFVQPYSLPIASASVLGGIRVGSGLSINSGTGVLSVTGASAASIKSTQTFVVTEGQTVFTVTGGYTPGLMDVFVNGVYLSPNQTTATNGTTFTINDPAATGDIVDIIVSSAIFEGSTTTTDQLPEGVINLYYTDARARAAISLTTNGSSGVATYVAGVLNIPNYRGLVPAGGNAGQILSKVDGTDYNTQWLNEAPAASYTSQLKHVVKAGAAINKGQAVYVSSSDGTNMIVNKASNASEQTSSKTLGLLESTVSNNGFANVITEGLLAGLDTTGANAAGDPVWLGTDGNLIYGLLNKPSAPAHLVFIGVVTRRNANNGEIFIKVQNGFEMGELHDYVQNGVQDNYVISYELSTSLYKPKSIATLLGYTPANAARSLTINGTSYDLTADRTWNVGTVTSVAALTIGTSGTDITSTVANSTTTPVITLNVPDASAFARGVITTGIQTIAGGKYFSDNVAIGHTSPFEVSQFSLDVNGGLLVKNSSKTAQFVLINSNPALGGNNAFVVHTVGGSSGTSYADIQGYYGTSIAGSTVLRLNPQGGNVLIGNLAGSGSRMVVASATGVLSTQAIQTLSDLNGVPTARTLTINGVTFDLSANRTWTINSMVYPSAGIAVSTGTAWATSITDNSSNWNTAFGWGNHASAGYATTTYVNTQVANLVASAPATLDTLNELAAALGNDAAFSTTVSTALGNRLRIDTASQGLNGTQQSNGRTNLGLGSLATLSSVGNSNITDLAYSKLSGVPSTFAPSAHTHVWTDITDRPTNLSAFTNGPGYITGISFANVSAKPTTIAGYGITDAITTSNIGSQSVTNSSQLNGLSKVQLWNNSGQNHTTYTSFGAIPNFGVWFMQGSSAGDSPQSGSQYYVQTQGLGNDYGYGTSPGNYGFMTAVARDHAVKYTYYRALENGAWGSWTKAAAGYADTAGSLSSMNISQFTNNSGYITGESDTLSSVTGRGASTSVAVTVSNNFTANDLRVTTGYLRSDNHIYNLTLSGSAQNVWAKRMLISESYYGNEGLIPFGSGLGKNTLWVHDFGASRKHGAVISCDNNGEAHIYAVDYANTSGDPGQVGAAGGWGWNMYYDGLGDEFFRMRIGEGGTWTEVLTIDRTENVRWKNTTGFTINGNTVWHAGNFTPGNYLPLSGGTLSGVLYFTDTTNGIYKSGGRMTVRSESTDNVANFASYGLYLPKIGETAGLYVESPIEARTGLRMGGSAANGTITVGADTAATANRLVQRDSGGDIYSRYSFAVHFNASCPNNENPSIAAIWTNSGTDNYLRKSTPAHLISQLGLSTTGHTHTSFGNLLITPSSASWAEGISFTMPSAGTWGGLRWRRERGDNDGNWYIGFTALDSTDDLVFGANNGGSQVNNILRLTKAGVMTNNGNQVLHAGNYNTYALHRDTDSEQQVGLRYLNWNEGIRRMNTDPRWNESGYDSDLGCLHIWAWTAGGSAYGRAGIALYNDGAYQYLTTKSGQTGMFLNNTQIITNSGTWGISITGNAGSVNGLSVTQIFNNMGQSHGTRTAFDASNPSYDFGFRYIQGTGNGPGTGGQYYSWYIGLGSDYPATGGGSYGAYFAVNRTSVGGGNPYLSVRYNENNSLSGWTKIYAGYADVTPVVNQPTYNQPAVRVNSSGTGSAGSSIAIQQITAEGWTGVFVDFEPNTGWGLYHDNPNNYFCVTAEATTGSLRSFTVPSRESGNRTAHEKIRFDQNNGSILAGGDITAFSDGRIKTNVEVVGNPIEKIKQIRGVTFLKTNSEGEDKNKRHAGVIAQEVLEVLPEVVNQDKDTGMYNVAYGNMAALFIEAIKEQQTQIESQKSEIEELKDLVKQLINR